MKCYVPGAPTDRNGVSYTAIEEWLKAPLTEDQQDAKRFMGADHFAYMQISLVRKALNTLNIPLSDLKDTHGRD